MARERFTGKKDLKEKEERKGAVQALHSEAIAGVEALK